MFHVKRPDVPIRRGPVPSTEYSSRGCHCPDGRDGCISAANGGSHGLSRSKICVQATDANELRGSGLRADNAHVSRETEALTQRGGA